VQYHPLRVVRWMLDHGADVNPDFNKLSPPELETKVRTANLKFYRTHTPLTLALHHARTKNHNITSSTELMQALLDAGAEVDIVCYPQFDTKQPTNSNKLICGLTPLNLAVRSRKYTVLQLLLDWYLKERRLALSALLSIKCSTDFETTDSKEKGVMTSLSLPVFSGNKTMVKIFGDVYKHLGLSIHEDLDELIEDRKGELIIDKEMKEILKTLKDG
jgi:hypothetical protein